MHTRRTGNGAIHALVKYGLLRKYIKGYINTLTYDERSRLQEYNDRINIGTRKTASFLSKSWGGEAWPQVGNDPVCCVDDS